MRNFDELLCTLPDGPAILNPPRHIRSRHSERDWSCEPRRRLASTRVTIRLTTVPSFSVWYSAGNDGYATLGTRGSIDKIELSADAAEELGADTICTYLAGQIHFDGRVDRNHAFILCNHKRVVDVFLTVELTQWIIIRPFIQSLGSQDKGQPRFFRGAESLRALVITPFSTKRTTPSREHFAVDAEIFLSPRKIQHRIWNGSDAICNVA